MTRIVLTSASSFITSVTMAVTFIDVKEVTILAAR